ncbi:ferredoxin [Amycolatopsis pithecellobii]|nr:ferredoxin [Amycolatopsis pithecellobii]
MARVEVDRDRCEGHGRCEMSAPEIYRLDDDGELEILLSEVGPDQRPGAEAGVLACPVAALRLSP